MPYEMDIFGLPSVALIVITAIFWRAGRSRWILADFGATMLCGISLLLTPRLLLEFQTDVRLDFPSIHMARVAGLVLLSTSLFSHCAFSSADGSEREALSRSRTVSASMLLLAAVYANQHYVEWNTRHVQLTVVGAACWFVPNLAHSLLTATCAKPEPAGVDFFLLMDHFITAVIAVAWFAFPQWLLRLQLRTHPNGVSVHVMRVLGAFLMGSSLVSLSATSFSSAATKKAVFISRSIASVPLLFLVIYAQTLGHFSALHIFAGVGTATLWTVNSLLGYTVISFAEQQQVAKQRRYNEIDAVDFGNAVRHPGDAPKQLSQFGARQQSSSTRSYPSQLYSDATETRPTQGMGPYRNQPTRPTRQTAFESKNHIAVYDASSFDTNRSKAM